MRLVVSYVCTSSRQGETAIDLNTSTLGSEEGEGRGGVAGSVVTVTMATEVGVMEIEELLVVAMATEVMEIEEL